MPLPYRDVVQGASWVVVAGSVNPGAFYASARLVRMVGEMRDTRVALAEAELRWERLRVSRDLHDLLGHSLAAISLIGDLAVRLLARDGPAALTEIENLTWVAREALVGLEDITNSGGKVTLTRELGNAQALLTAAGVAVSVRGDIPGIPPAAEQVLAWTVREGATNILRHATASTVTITLERRDGLAWLEILNDGAHPPANNDWVRPERSRRPHPGAV